jgi:hypothetical protein
MKTLQETFDKMVNHLRKQNSKSLLADERDDTCAYRGKDGKMCAVGCLIEDEFYDPSLEENIVYDEKVKNALRNSGYYIDVTLEDGADLRPNDVVSIGDYIIKGSFGEFYPCKPDIFDFTYEDVK